MSIVGNLIRHFLSIIILSTAISLRATANISAADRQKYEAITKQLSTIKEMRVYMSYAPGSGHQYATMTVMKYLRHLGFSGSFDLVYADDLRKKNSTLMVKLFPFMDTAKTEKQCSSTLKICLSSFSNFKNDSNGPHLPFGITGADDGNIHSPHSFSKSYIGATDLKVHKYMMLQPFDWNGRQGIDIEGKSFLSQDLSGVGLAFFDSGENLKETKAVLDELEKSPQTKTVGKNFRDLFINVERYDIQTVYGIGLISHLPEVVSLIGAAISGLGQYSQAANIELYTRRPKLMLVFSNLNEAEWAYTSHGLGIINSDLRPIDDSKISLLSINDPNFSEKLRALNSRDQARDQLSIINIGRADQSLYHFFKKASDMPAIVAGKNAVDEARTMGVPFFNSVADYSFSWTPPGLDNGSALLPSEPFAAEVKELREVTDLIRSGTYDDQLLNRVRSIMVQSFTPNSNFYKLFRSFEMNDQSRQYRFDKIAQILTLAFSEGLK
jgi:hypothetical protein